MLFLILVYLIFLPLRKPRGEYRFKYYTIHTLNTCEIFIAQVQLNYFKVVSFINATLMTGSLLVDRRDGRHKRTRDIYP